MSFADRQEPIAVTANWLRSWPRRYAFALAAVSATALVRYALGEAFAFSHSFALFYPTILIVALIAGFRPGLMATLLSVLAVAYFFLNPRFSFAVAQMNDRLRLAIFGFAGMAMCWFADSARVRARQAPGI